MCKRIIRITVSTVFLASLFLACIPRVVSAAQEQMFMGWVVKQGNQLVIEADDGDYIVKGKDVSKLVERLVEVTGTIIESDKGEIIVVKSIQDVQDTQPD